MTVPALEIAHCQRRCEQITRRQAANFYYGIRLLPRDRRDAMCAVYAFARRIDDIGDDGDDRDAQLQALREQRAMLTRLDLDDSSLDDPVRIALAHARRHYALPLDALELLIEGVELDVVGTEYETFEQLDGYCRRVAGTIGRLCVAIFTDGRATETDTRLADELGVAMQLTNILRDVREDAIRGRTYLPAEDLRRFGCEDLAQLAAATGDGAGSLNGSAAGAIDLIRFEADRAAEWFERGMRLTESLDRRSASCVHAMTGIYRTILQRIVADPAQVLRHRVSLSGWEKGMVAARSLTGAGRATTNGAPR
ncbi:MAG TPA: squalene/phytoene synthase family protein [Solirubrobacteraceae bacterium]|nr:squalene/phytoene synthase family protein [Solirubrobacteraceae bacterium]